MLRQVQDRYTVQVTCASCGVQFVVILAVQGEGVSAETKRRRWPSWRSSSRRKGAEAPEPIALDELLDVHVTLRDFQGSLTDLIAAPDQQR